MSKIYEALLRAEQEKAADAESQPEMRQSAGEHKFSRANAQSSKAPSEALSKADDSPARDQVELLRDPAQLSQRTTLQVWQPDLAKLPSLQSRGGKIEQFRSLRSKLAGLRHVQHLKSIYIGSGHAGEGKSFIASNLAVTLARHKTSRVLLIDGDMRRGTLHKVLGCSNSNGLAEYLSGKADTKHVLQRGTAPEGDDPLPQGLSNLTFCSSGSAGDRAAELSGSPRFAELIREVSEEFDWIIVDSSPVNLVSDGVNLARACDSALLVVRGGETKFETAQRALRELKAAKLLGVVLNAVSDFAPNEGNYGYQSYESLNG